MTDLAQALEHARAVLSHNDNPADLLCEESAFTFADLGAMVDALSETTTREIRLGSSDPAEIGNFETGGSKFIE